jgi:hypothetical protein
MASGAGSARAEDRTASDKEAKVEKRMSSGDLKEVRRGCCKADRGGNALLCSVSL